MLPNPIDNSRGPKAATYLSALPPSATVRRWLHYHLVASHAPIDRARNSPALRPPEYRDLLQAKLTDFPELA